MPEKTVVYKGTSMPLIEDFEFDRDVDIGVILEQNWMLYEIAHRFQENGEMIYCFAIDRDIYVLKRDRKSFAFLQAQGSSHEACYVEEFRKRNAKKIYRIGTCGALQKDLEVGDIIVSTGAVRDEGTTDQYISKYFPAVADPQTTRQLYDALSSKGLPVKMGLTWTTDGRFVESNEKIVSFSKLNVKNVDMETSPLLLISWIHGIPAASIGIVTDRPIDDIDSEFKGEIHDFAKTKEMLTGILYDITESILEMG